MMRLQEDEYKNDVEMYSLILIVIHLYKYLMKK